MVSVWQLKQKNFLGNKAYLAEANTDPGAIRQYAFGEITDVWEKKTSEIFIAFVV